MYFTPKKNKNWGALWRCSTLSLSLSLYIYIYSYIYTITLLLHTQYWIFNKSKNIEELLCYFMARFVSYSYLMLLMFLVMTEEIHGGNSWWFSFLEPNFCYMHKNFRKRVKLNSFFYRWILESYVFIYCPFVCFSGRWQYIIEIFFPKRSELVDVPAEEQLSALQKEVINLQKEVNQLDRLLNNNKKKIFNFFFLLSVSYIFKY